MTFVAIVVERQLTMGKIDGIWLFNACLSNK